MFAMVHLALPTHVIPCPNILFYWKCVNAVLQHLKMLSLTICQAMCCAVCVNLYYDPNSYNYFFKGVVSHLEKCAYLLFCHKLHEEIDTLSVLKKYC